MKDENKAIEPLINRLVELLQRIAELEAPETGRKEIQEQLIQKEKLAALGKLARGIEHELRNSIGAIKNAAYFLNMALEEPEPEVKDVNWGSGRANHLILH